MRKLGGWAFLFHNVMHDIVNRSRCGYITKEKKVQGALILFRNLFVIPFYVVFYAGMQNFDMERIS